MSLVYFGMVAAGYLGYSVADGALRDLNASLALINTLNGDGYLQAFNLCI